MRKNYLFAILYKLSFCLCLIILLGSCKVYKQNIIFQTDQSINAEAFAEEVSFAEGEYVIQAFDNIEVEVFTNKGERVIDPNLELSGSNGNTNIRPSNQFQVFADQTIILPLIGVINVEGETIKSLQEKLTKLYANYYIEPLVRLSVGNQRVIVLGDLGGQIIPLENNNTSLLEILAAAGGLNNSSRGSNIRLIRGPLESPNVQIINLQTIEGMKQANLRVMPNDIVYVEPIRRVFNESFRDAAPFIGVITNLITILIVVQNLN